MTLLSDVSLLFLCLVYHDSFCCPFVFGNIPAKFDQTQYCICKIYTMEYTMEYTMVYTNYNLCDNTQEQTKLYTEYFTHTVQYNMSILYCITTAYNVPIHIVYSSAHYEYRYTEVYMRSIINKYNTYTHRYSFLFAQ